MMMMIMMMIILFFFSIFRIPGTVTFLQLIIYPPRFVYGLLFRRTQEFQIQTIFNREYCSCIGLEWFYPPSLKKRHTVVPRTVANLEANPL